MPSTPVGPVVPVAAAATAPKAADSLAAEPYVVRSLVSRTLMNADGTGTREQTYEIQLQSEAAVHLFSVISIGFAAATEHAEFVYARVRRPDGTVLETAVDAAVEQPQAATREAPTYSDLNTKELPIRSLRVGDTLEWKSRITEVQPEAKGQFWGQETFAKGAVVLSEVHELQVPEAVRVTVWTNPRAGATAVESVAGGRRTWRWEHADLSPTVGAAAEARKLADEKKMLTAEEELDATKGPLPSMAWTTFPDWAAVGAWYRGLIAGQSAPDAAVRARVAELTAGKTTQTEKAEAIYYYVSSQVHYIGVSFGVGRFKPHTAAEVLANQYGDCKDKHTLLESMLGIIGVQAEPVLIGVGLRFNDAVPSPAVFNHLITRTSLGSGPVWLDATNEVAPWRALLFGVRDQQALLVSPTAAATVVRTPAELPYPATMTVRVKGVLDGKLTSESEMTYEFHDDLELALRLGLRAVPSSGYGEAAQRLMGSFGFGGTISDARFEHLDDRSQPLRMIFHYRREADESWGQNRVTMPFAPQFLPAFAVNKPPTSSIELGIPRTETTRVEETIPKGWTATLPEAVHERTAFAASDVTYRMDGDHLVAERKLTVLRQSLPASQVKTYQAWYDRADAGGVPYLQLQPPAKDKAADASTRKVPLAGPKETDAPSVAAGGTSPAQPSGAPQKSAAELVAAAKPLIEANDAGGARKLLDKAKLLNAKEEGLWTGYADLDRMTGQAAAVAGDLRLEVQYHPSETGVYNALAVQQSSSGDSAGAVATLREWVHEFPLDRDAALYLVGQLERSKRYQEALDEANDALKRLGKGGEDLSPLRTAAARLAREVPTP